MRVACRFRGRTCTCLSWEDDVCRDGHHGCGLAKVEMEEVVTFLVENHPHSVVVEDATEIGQVAGRWLVKALTVDLKP